MMTGYTLGASFIGQMEKLVATSNGQFDLQVGLPQFASAMNTSIKAPGVARFANILLCKGKTEFAEEMNYQRGE
jgi:hypothetical protein